MNKFIWFVLCAMLFALCLPGEAQQTKIPKIGELVFRPGSTLGSGRESFRRALRELGYVEGKNIAFETRSAEGRFDRFPALADELVRLKVDVLFASSTTEALAFKKATRTIPIVFLAGGDPVVSGLVDSLARPGENLTGFTNIEPVLAGKRLELLKEIVPKLSRVAVLWNPKTQGSEQSWKESQLSARELGLQLHSMEVSSADKFENAFKEATKARSGALASASSSLFNPYQKLIADLATKYRLPAIYSRADYAASGGMMSYGPDRAEPFKRAAVMVDKILKGAKPADLPIEQPTKFEFVINLKTAKALNLTIPQSVLYRADKVIK